MRAMTETPLSQRSELTHKPNRFSGRHGWLRLTPAYSVKLVSAVLARFEAPISVLDPFSGTGTSILAAAERGHAATGIDINPFLVWLGNAKLGRYDSGDVACASAAIDPCLAEGDRLPVPPPPIHNVERWWHPDVLAFLSGLKGRIEAAAGRRVRVRNLLHVAFCQTLIRLSNAAFNHQSMSFASEGIGNAHSLSECAACFRENARSVLKSLDPNPAGKGRILLGDSRAAPVDGPYDLLLTSPPYPNRMSYVRELRPYMYWLGYLTNGKDAGELDWTAIGGTWGSATSRLANWRPEANVFLPQALRDAVSSIRDAGGANGALLSTYVLRYFCDTWRHVANVKTRLREAAKAVYIVGNSTFYGILVPVERIYAEILDMAGFVNVRIEPIRKRNSKKELYEYAVEADFAKPSPLGPVATYRPREAPTLF